MYDSIVCGYKLPLPDDQGELKDYNWKEAQFQTKSLDNLLLHFVIDEDGQLWENQIRYKRDENDTPLLETGYADPSKISHHGEVHFYDFIPGKSYDYDIEFKATFTEGKVVKMELVEWKSVDNTNRLELEREWKERQEQVRKKRQTLLWKIYHVTWDQPVRKLFRQYGKLLNWLISGQYRLEKKIRFWS